MSIKRFAKSFYSEYKEDEYDLSLYPLFSKQDEILDDLRT